MDKTKGKIGSADLTELSLESRVLFINRVAKVLAGGRRFRFTALVAVGDGNGRVGMALGKAPEVVDAIRKGEELARKNLISISRRGSTVPYEIKEHFCASTVLLRPAREGSGITAGGPARTLLSLAGITDCTAKFFGSNNRINCAKATFEAMKKIKEPQELIERRLKYEEWRKKRLEVASTPTVAGAAEIGKEAEESGGVNAGEGSTSVPSHVASVTYREESLAHSPDQDVEALHPGNVGEDSPEEEVN